MIRFDEIEDKTKWNEFLSQNGGSFTESWEWGEVQRKEGGKVSRFFICEGNEILGAVAIYVKRTPAGSYGYIPRGPAIGERVFDRNEWEEFVKLLHDFSKAKDLIFLLWEPLKEGEFGELKKTKGRQPAKTILIDLSKPLEDLLRDINKTKRYGIRHAEGDGTKIVLSDKSDKDFDKFWKLMRVTASRKHFGTFGEEHFRNIFKEGITELFLAEYDNEVEAASEVIFFGETAVYLHAGTSGKNERLTASYLLIWEILKEAKKRGLKYFDLWGIDEKRWPGVTAFKKSFGGYEVSFPDARILINKRFGYLIYKLMHLARRVLTLGKG